MVGHFILPAICLLVYHNALDCGFVFDDVSAIKSNNDLRPSTPWQNLFYNDFWGTPMTQEESHKSYRPITVLTFRLNYWWGGLDPAGYHLLNVALHALVTFQLYLLCKDTLRLSEVTSLSSSLLFAVHPVHVEAVTGVVGRAELLSASLALLTFSVYVNQTKSGGVIGYLLLFLLLLAATLCKEQGITIAAVCVLYDVFVVQQLTLSDAVDSLTSLLKCRMSSLSLPIRQMIARCAVLSFITIFILIIRLYAMGAQLPAFTTFDNPASNQPSPYRQLTFNYLIALDLWLLICPAQLCCDWTMGTVPVVESLLDYRNLITALVYAGVYKLLRYSLQRRNLFTDQMFMALALMIFPFLPASNMFFHVGFVIAERVLYMPSVGYCLLAGAVFNLLYSHCHKHNMTAHRHLLTMSFGLLILSGSMRSYVRNKDWRSEYTLFASALRFTENNAKVWNNVGHALESEGNYTEALHYFRSAARVQPDDIGSHVNVGRTLKWLGETSQAEQSLNRALDLLPATKKGESYMARIAPTHLNVFITLGRLISQNESRWSEAEALYRRALSMRPEFVQVYMNYGDLLLRMGRRQEAISQYNTALHYDRDDPDIHYNLGVVYLELKQHQQAMNHFNNALDINPNHQQSLYNTALMMQEAGHASHYPEAQRRLKILMKLEPENPKVYFTAALLATDIKRYELAEEYFIQALQIDPEFQGALFNIALLLANDLGRPKDGVPYLERNLRLNPAHVKSYLLLGDIAINHMKNTDLAEKCFNEIVRLDPSHTQGRHNICVVHAERGDLVKAEQCLVDVHNRAPEEAYIKQHLQIVRSRLASHKKKRP